MSAAAGATPGNGTGAGIGAGIGAGFGADMHTLARGHEINEARRSGALAALAYFRARLEDEPRNAIDLGRFRDPAAVTQALAAVAAQIKIGVVIV